MLFLITNILLTVDINKPYSNVAMSGSVTTLALAYNFGHGIKLNECL